ncbi:nuclear transport factor 2 family protein [Pseudarthrobacter cellobiosi]|uniref:nuclear transport factor 2 family protein n=1 Tax=Pseudarthrobacter cellobiosi TaxID=2953654 RepID=UPI00208E7B6E|nr:nuclear transport factor 2 family protein [Pseudarthrobacter sp. HLT1-5]
MAETRWTQISADDYEDVRRLKARYFRYIYLKRWSDLRTLFSVDTEILGFSFSPADPDTFVEAVSAYMSGMVSIHQAFMPQLERQSDDSIRGIWSMFDQLTWEPDSREYQGFDVPGMWEIRGYGHYEEEYVRTAEGWRISFFQTLSAPSRAAHWSRYPIPAFSLTPATEGWLD